MKKFYFVALVLLFCLAGGLFYLFSLQTPAKVEKSGESIPQRIISLSPSTTETLYALGLGEQVVGVTRFCNFPPEAKQKPSVGGYVDPNYEAIVALKPDLVFILPEHEKVKTFLAELGLKYITVNNKTIDDILSTIRTIGAICEAEEKANALISHIQVRMERIHLVTKNLEKPKVLVSIGRTIGSGALQEVYIAGQNTFYNELIEAAGGTNAYSDEKLEYPMLSAEGILQINPAIIFDLVPDLEAKHLTDADVIAEWKTLEAVDAVKRQQVFVLSQSYIVIPGPRFILLLEDFARIIHPEVAEAAETTL